MQRIPNATKDVLTEFVLDHVERGSEVRTDRNIAQPFGWTFTREKLDRVLDKITDREHAPIAAAA